MKSLVNKLRPLCLFTVVPLTCLTSGNSEECHSSSQKAKVPARQLLWGHRVA